MVHIDVLHMPICEDSLLDDEPVGVSHLMKHNIHPVLDTTICHNCLTEWHQLTLARNHGKCYRFVVRALPELEWRYVVEHLQIICTP